MGTSAVLCCAGLGWAGLGWALLCCNYAMLWSSQVLQCLVMQGLTMLEKATGKLVVLSNQVSADSPLSPGVKTNYANDLDISKDGIVYFSTSTDKPVIPNLAGFLDTFHTFVLELLQVS